MRGMTPKVKARKVKPRSFHDHIVNLVVRHWAKTMGCNVAVNTVWKTGEQAGSTSGCPDLMGWKAGLSHNTVEWIAEVETEESFSELDAHGRWQDYTALRLPFYLFVPKGYGTTARSFATRAGVRVNRIYEYELLLRNEFQLR
jgi:hypothetical protein